MKEADLVSTVMVVCFGDAAQGKRAISTGIFLALACVSVRPHQAISGSV